MRPERKLSLPQLIVGALIESAAYLNEGHMSPPMWEAIRVFGVRGTLNWLVHIGKTMSALAKRYGEANAQTLVGLAAMWNGCGFCGYGHMHAGVLVRFRDTGVVSPLDAYAVREFMEMTDEEIVGRLKEMLDDEKFHDLRDLALRQYELKAGIAQDETDDDAFLQAAIAAWDWLNECSIIYGLDANPETVPPIASVAKDKNLMTRFLAARAAQRRGLPPGPGASQ